MYQTILQKIYIFIVYGTKLQQLNRYSMVIEKGTEVKVAPDVGLLVLGALSTFGSESQPIKFTPLESHKRVKRSDQK